MPIYTYDCPVDGACDMFSRTVGPPFEVECPTCKGKMTNCVTAPARIFVDRDWNELASDYQGHGAYHQAKSQLQNYRRSSLEHLGRDCDRPPNPVTEEAIQISAQAIHEGEVNPRPDPQQRQIQKIRQAQRKTKLTP